MSSRSVDRLGQLFQDAARRRYPSLTWDLEVVPRPHNVTGVVVAFTGFHVVAADIDPALVQAKLGEEDDPTAPFRPPFLTWLGERLGTSVGHIDATLARLGAGRDDGWLQPIDDPPDNERVRRARALRSGVEYLVPPDRRGVVTVGVGLGGRRELSMEIGAEDDRGSGLGTRLVAAAADRMPAGEAVFATVAPGNARSLRCLLAAGFSPIGAECHFSGHRHA